MQRAVTLATVGLVAAMAVAGCGDEPGPEQRVTDAVQGMQDAYSDDDMEGLCAAMTEAAWVQVGSAGHGEPASCQRDMAIGRKRSEASRVAGYARTPTIRNVVIEGSKATVTADLGNQEKRRVALVERDGTWKLDDYYGSTGGFLDNATGLAKPPTQQPRSPVAVVGPGGAPCPPVRPAGKVLNGFHTELRGGCKMKARQDDKVHLRVRTLFGVSKFGDCDMKLTLRADGRGRVWIDELVTSGAIGCNDVTLCRTNLIPRPWRGYIEADGRLLVNACFATCVGQFRDELVLQLDRSGPAWRIEADRVGIGDGGFEMDGTLRLTSHGVDIKLR